MQTLKTKMQKQIKTEEKKAHRPVDAVVVASWVVLRGRSCCGGAALADGRLLGGYGGCGLDVTAMHLHAAQALPVAPLQQQVALCRRACTTAASGAPPPRVVVIPRLLLHFSWPAEINRVDVDERMELNKIVKLIKKSETKYLSTDKLIQKSLDPKINGMTIEFHSTLTGRSNQQDF
jgi:hypothetical protein